MISHSKEDEIVKAMMENRETREFAEQRVYEMIKEGMSVEQEL